jgi:hypothetical protein
MILLDRALLSHELLRLLCVGEFAADAVLAPMSNEVQPRPEERGGGL